MPTELKLMTAMKVREERTRAELLKIRQAYMKMAKIVEEQGAKVNGDDESTKFKKKYFRNLTTQLRQESKNMTIEMISDIKTNMYDIADAVVRDNVKWLDKLGMNVEGAFSYVPKDVVNNIVTGKVYDTGWSLSKRIWGNSEKDMDDIYNIVASGIGRNLSIKEITKDLVKFVDPSAVIDGKWNKDYPKVNRKKIEYNAQRLAKTLSNHAFQQAYVKTTFHNPFISCYHWNCGHNDRTCPICIDREQSDQYGLGAGNFPKGALPLDHPNGFCFITGVSIYTNKNMADRIADWYNNEPGYDKGLDDFAKSMGYDFKPGSVKKQEKVEKPKEPQRGSKEWFDKNLGQFMSKAELTPSMKDYFMKRLGGASETYQDAWVKCANNLERISEFNKDRGSYYTRSTNSINISLTDCAKRSDKYNQDNKMRTLFHEMGHCIDAQIKGTNRSLSSSKKFLDAFSKDMDRISDKVGGFSYDEKFLDKMRNLYKDHNSAGVQDVLGSFKFIDRRNSDFVFDEELDVRLSWSHSDEYWTRSAPKKEACSELFAHISSGQVSEKEMNFIKDYFPNSTEAFDELLKGELKKKK